MAIAGQSATQNVGIDRWWRVVGGLSMNMALGATYASSVFVAPLEPIYFAHVSPSAVRRQAKYASRTSSDSALGTDPVWGF